MLIRIRSKDGTFRFDLPPNADISVLLQKIVESGQDVDPSTITLSNQPRGGETNVGTLKGRNLQSLGLKHGDLIFVAYKSQAGPAVEQPPIAVANTAITQPSASGESGAPKRLWETVVEDGVDTYWRSQDGKIPRSRDTRFCKHGANAMCDHCLPLEPFDPSYHAENSIKHLSYHAYLRKLVPNTSSTVAAALPPLNPFSYKVKTPCSNSHPPWPEGICTACQPSAITLQPQSFRMVDHLEFSSHEMVNRFLQAWRVTGAQRFGWLLGRYEPYDKVPMGIKAVVEAIHEPPQEGELDGLTLGVPWEDEQRIRALAASVPGALNIVGYMFTDLDPSEEDRTKNVYKRHADSFYLSSLEAIFAATLQLQNPCPSRSSPTGIFSSRLVTAIATASESGDVDIAAYQVSEQAAAMVEADMIEASVDPGIVRVKEEDRSKDTARYVPDVFFRYKNEYGLEVKKSAKPSFPVEYLLVNVTHGFPQNPSPVFHSNEFAIENRPGIEDQDIQHVLKLFSRLQAVELKTSKDPTTTPEDIGRRSEVVKTLSDWHLIAFLGSTQLLSDNDLRLLMRAVTGTGREHPELFDELLASDSWQTLMTFTREHAPAPQRRVQQDSYEDLPQEVRDQIAQIEAQSAGAAPAGVHEADMDMGGGNLRICPHCTFENPPGGSDCEVCGLPLS